MRINYRLGWLAVGGRGGRRAGSRVPLDGGRDTKQRGEDEAVVSADLQTNEHASERDGQPADLSAITSLKLGGGGLANGHAQGPTNRRLG